MTILHSLVPPAPNSIGGMSGFYTVSAVALTAGAWVSTGSRISLRTRLARHRQRSATYQGAENGDPEYRLRRVQAWLTTIAERLAYDMLAARRRHPVIQIEQEEWQEVPAGLDGAVSDKTTAVRHLIESILTDREQDVILTTFHWYDPDRAHQKLPEHVLSDLARRWNTSQDNIRQIRSRALSKLKPALESVVARTSNEG